MSEEWRPIPNASGFEASSLGRIRARGKIRRHSVAAPSPSQPYRRVSIFGRQEYVHRCVLAAFVGVSDLECNHKNGVKCDNRIENLEYVTAQYNTRHAWSTGLNENIRRAVSLRSSSNNPGPSLSGEDNRNHKLTEAQVREIRASSSGSHELAGVYKVNASTINRILNRTTWRHL